MSEDYDHLHPSYRANARLGDEERIAWIRSDRWISHPRAEAALVRLGDLLVYPARDRMPCLLLFGDTGMGKTKIVRKFVRGHPPVFHDGTGVTTMPVVAFQMPPEPAERDFYDELLRALGAPRRRLDTMLSMRDTSRRLLREMGTRLLIVDEIHAMLAGTYRQQRLFLNTIRFLANDLRLCLVCVGTDEARQALVTDPQLSERFEALELPRWRDDAALRGLLASLAAILPLRRPSRLDTPVVRKRLMDMTDGVTVRLFRLIEVAAVAAIRNGREHLDAESFDDPGLVLPLVSMTMTMDRRLKRRSPAAG